jgi:hypothetical protein
MPAAFAANANLFVSAENSQFDNYMSGPQVIEVVVIDSDINDTDEAKGEPDVTINGKILRMVQAVDGNWYGYFADKDMATIADNTTTTPGVGLDFGEVCTTTQAGNAIPTTANPSFFGDADGVAFSDPACGTAFNATNINVLREAKDININPSAGTNFGQIGVKSDAWPFIQVYELNPTGNVVVQYNKGGGAQTTTLTFDTVDQFAGAELDKSSYGRGDEVHATVTDLWLNVDPTDEDSWTFGTTGIGGGANTTTNYQVFDENGQVVGDVPANAGPANLLTGALPLLMCEDNCILLTTADVQNKGFVITVADNDDSEIITVDAASDTGLVPDGTLDPQNPWDWATANGNMFGHVPVTITEQGPNSGVFGSYDESDDSAIQITTDAARGTSASIDYNETPATILVGFSFGSIDIQPVDDEWSSGEEIPVVLVDADANLNSRADEDLDLFNPDVALIPALRTGSPATLDGLAQLANGSIAAGAASLDGTTLTGEVQAFSDRAMLTSASGTITSAGGATSLILDFGDSNDFLNAAPADDTVIALFNYDVRSVGFAVGDTTVDSISLCGTPITTGSSNAQGLILIKDLNTSFACSNLVANFTFTGTTDVSATTIMPVVADVFGFGFVDDGVETSERVANQIIRLELEETGDNTSTFEGTLEYTMVNQLNIGNAATYEALSTIADDPTFIVIEDLTDEDSPRVNYLDLGADGVSTQVSDQEEAPSHSGIVSFDNDSYKIADTVTITLEDADLNVDTDLIDIFTVVSEPTDPAFDAVGADLDDDLVFSFGPLGRLLDVTFDDQAWKTSDVCVPSGDADTGLGDSGFSLIETDSSSGIFVGDFQIPSNWCREGATEPETTTGLDIEVNYVDFRDASGEIIEVGDSAGVRANTGSVSLDRTVYPVPFGTPDNFDVASGETSPDNRSIFAIHATGINDDLNEPGTFLPDGVLTIHVRVNDPDFDISASGEDVINQNTLGTGVGPVEISIQRGSETIILGHLASLTMPDLQMVLTLSFKMVVQVVA